MSKRIDSGRDWVKNGGRRKSGFGVQPDQAPASAERVLRKRFVKGGNVKNGFKLRVNSRVSRVLGATVLLASGLFAAGCKSGPPLTVQQAQALIQAKYDQAAPTPISINVNDPGMLQGIDAKYWTRTRVYPNRFWADFTLTPEGKKLVTISGGGDVIQWRPMRQNDANYSVNLNTVATSRLKAVGVHNLQDESVPGSGKGKGVDYDEVVDFTGIPSALSSIGHNPGNQISVQRHADFALVNGQWTLHSIE